MGLCCVACCLFWLAIGVLVCVRGLGEHGLSGRTTHPCSPNPEGSTDAFVSGILARGVLVKIAVCKSSCMLVVVCRVNCECGMCACVRALLVGVCMQHGRIVRLHVCSCGCMCVHVSLCVQSDCVIVLCLCVSVRVCLCPRGRHAFVCFCVYVCVHALECFYMCLHLRGCICGCVSVCT